MLKNNSKKNKQKQVDFMKKPRENMKIMKSMKKTQILSLNMLP